jgi:uncharacterized Zn-binding protein involved in type VI secretion
MASLVCRVGDVNAGGGVILEGNPTVLINGRPVAIIGSKVSPHPPCPKPSSHCSATTQFKPGAVLVNGRPISTAPSTDTCGHPRLTGSLNVVVGK